MNSEFYETIEEIKVYQKKQTTLSFVRMAASIITLIIIVAVMIIIVPKALNTVEHFNATLSNMDIIVSDAGEIVSSVKNAASSSWVIPSLILCALILCPNVSSLIDMFIFFTGYLFMRPRWVMPPYHEALI